MANKQIVFADRLVGFSVQNGLARLDFAVNAGQVKDKDGKTGQRMEITSQLVMPLDAFVNAVAMQQNALKQVASRAQQVAGKDKTEAKAEAGDKAEKAEKAEKAPKAKK